jgi:5-enolpyruvylshikimate-3-phosphate synthase
MTLAVAGLIAHKGETIVRDVACVNTSFPEFESLLEQLVER